MGIEVHRGKGAQPAATLGDGGRGSLFDMGLICPPAIVQSLPMAQVLNLPPGGSCDIIRQWTCSGAWPILVLTFDHLVSHRNFPSSAPDKCWNLSPVRAPSLVLSETASSASPQNRRGVAVHLRICLTCATGFGRGIGLQGQLGQRTYQV